MSLTERFDIRGRVALVTGGSGELGSAMAHGLAEVGVRVAVMGRRSAACERVAAAIRAAGGEAIGVAGDVMRRDEVERAVAQVVATLGPIDILVNGAGGNQPGATTGTEQPFFAIDGATFSAVVDSNLMGAVTCSQVVGKLMAERQQGTIINIASMSGIRPLTRVVAYSAAKAALANFTQWLAVHLAQEYSPAIRVNAIAPGFFLTEQNRFLLTEQATGDWTARGQTIIGHTPQGRFGAGEDLIGALLWLASPAAAFVTGIVVPIDGGFSAFGGV